MPLKLSSITNYSKTQNIQQIYVKLTWTCKSTQIVPTGSPPGGAPPAPCPAGSGPRYNRSMTYLRACGTPHNGHTLYYIKKRFHLLRKGVGNGTILVLYLRKRSCCILIPNFLLFFVLMNGKLLCNNFTIRGGPLKD